MYVLCMYVYIYIYILYTSISQVGSSQSQTGASQTHVEQVFGWFPVREFFMLPPLLYVT